MLKITAENAARITVTADVIANLVGKEALIVEQVAGSLKVQLYTNGIPYAVLGERIQDSGQWFAYPINSSGIVPCIAGGAINTPAYVKVQAGGKVIAASSGNQCVGTKRNPVAASADGDVIGVDLALMIMP